MLKLKCNFYFVHLSFFEFNTFKCNDACHYTRDAYLCSTCVLESAYDFTRKPREVVKLSSRMPEPIDAAAAFDCCHPLRSSHQLRQKSSSTLYNTQRTDAQEIAIRIYRLRDKRYKIFPDANSKFDKIIEFNH